MLENAGHEIIIKCIFLPVFYLKNGLRRFKIYPFYKYIYVYRVKEKDKKKTKRNKDDASSFLPC